MKALTFVRYLAAAVSGLSTLLLHMMWIISILEQGVPGSVYSVRFRMRKHLHSSNLPVTKNSKLSCARSVSSNVQPEGTTYYLVREQCWRVPVRRRSE